jgi:glycosyltransferase involved in cell wall biosynthesis
VKPLVSLLICTLGRTSELGYLLDSLDAQTYRNFEVILVDQNHDDRLASLLQQFEKRLSIKHLRSLRGLSHGRNAGLSSVRGTIVAFPDDDCEYPPDLLARVVQTLDSSPTIAGLCGRTINSHGQDVVSKFDRDPGPISAINLWWRSTSATIFLRTAVTRDIGSFDERLGAGSGTPWGAGEEIDYLCRALKSGYKLIYDPELCVLHPSPPTDNSLAARQRASSYGRAMGFVLGNQSYPLWFAGYMILRPVGGAVLDILRCRLASARLRWRVARARATGYWQSRAASTNDVQHVTEKALDTR